MYDLENHRARRRHQPHYNIDQTNSIDNSNLQNNFEEDNKKQQQPTTTVQQRSLGFLPSSDQLAGFSQYIAAPATQFWNTAQSFADQYAFAPREQTPEPLAGGNPTTFEEDTFDPFQVIEMPYRDRTAEFKTICKSEEMKYLSNGRVQNREEKTNLLQSSKEFNARSKRISRYLSITCAKMEKLTELAKKKSLFEDNTIEIERLSKDVQEDIKGLNNQIDELNNIVKQQHSSNQVNNHSKLVVVGLQSKLASVGQNFKSVLDLRTQNLKAKKGKREKYCQAEPVPSSMPKSRSNVLFNDDASASRGTENGGANFVLEMDQMQVQSPLLDNTDSYYRDRLGAMENIESSITQLGQIFSQLAHLVQEQGEMITRIDSNVEATSMNVEAAHTELLRYFNNISKNRWLIIKVFGVLMAFIVFFIVFMA
uniref:t-SNARE coiled-coil homology domain-containing protein n=1 Tax=Panagrolaimus sp. ES5 TaxID=591445 RepID=A0AC34FRA3_9BILA